MIKNYLHILLVILFASCLRSISYAQDTVFIKYNKDWTADVIEYKTDTIIFASGMTRHVLTGTTVLPQTHSQQLAKNHGIYFDNVSRSDCKNKGGKYYPAMDSINSIAITDSTISVDITVHDNCCYDFLCDISIDSTGILNIIYQGYGTYCFCNCCFGLICSFSVLQSADFKKIKGVMLKGRRETVKMVNGSR